ncbi:uncharacterized protein mRpL48 [Planococcus citri]|uniref:uncharacterized protein mRpL48 n=1 Tax=Planococcus citri TaxID=170843 RepID=UPI0031F848C0
MFPRTLSLLRGTAQRSNFQISCRNTKSTAYYEPPYLESSKAKYPVYEALTVQVKGYDYPQLENFQKYAHTMATYMDIPVEYCWAHPARHHEVRRFKHHSSAIDATYKILTCERNLKIVNVDSLVLPLYIEVLHTALPEGSKLSVFTFDPEHEKDRYVPDHDLISKMKELDELGGPPRDAVPIPKF